jgi:hypothetical protein
MENTTVPYSRLLAEADHMGYNIDITEYKCNPDSYEWHVPYTVMRCLKKRPAESWSNTSIYHMKCTMRYGHTYRVPSNVICYTNKITKQLVHYCDICDPYLVFLIHAGFTNQGTGGTKQQTTCTHSKWFSLYIDQV